MALESFTTRALRRSGNPALGTERGDAAVPLRLAVAMLLLATLVVGWPWLSGRVTIPWDAKATFLPQIQFLAQSIWAGQSPAWLPYAFSGHPQVADPQAMIFSPPFLTLSLLNSAPSLRAVDATLFAMIFLGGAALMVWFRDRGWHWAGGLIAALAFCFGGSMAWRIQHLGQVLSLAYLPIALLCLDRAFTRRSVIWGAATGIAAGFILLGRDQVALLGIYLLTAYALWRILSADEPAAAARASLGPGLTAGLSAALLVAVPILLTVLLAAESNRPSIDYAGAGRGSLHPALLLTLIAPDLYAASGRMEDYWGPPSFAWSGTDLFVAQNMGVLYLGAIPLLMLLLGALRGDLWQREVRFFTCAALLMLLYAVGKYTPLFQVCYALLPGVSLYRRPADATFLAGGLASILAGYVVHRLFREPKAQIARGHVAVAAGAFAICCLLAIVLALWIGRLELTPRPLGAAVLTFAIAGGALLLLRPRIAAQPMVAAAALAGITTVDLAVNNGPSSATGLPPAVYDVLQPTTTNATIAILKSKVVQNGTRRDRIELAGLGFHWPNASLTHGLENTLGYNPVRLALYSAATGAEDHVGLPEQRKFSPLFPSYRSTLANLLGLRLIATGVPVESIDKSLKPGDLALLARTSDGYIYENPDAFDRVLFVTRAQAADFSKLLLDGRWPAADLRTTVLLEQVPAPPARARGPGTVRIADYRNTSVTVDVDSPDGGWVVLNDLWHPWWFAEIDGKPAPVLRANVLFRAVAGRHTVQFRFRPIAGALAALGLGSGPGPRHEP
jgi:hypothetical protein